MTKTMLFAALIASAAGCATRPQDIATSASPGTLRAPTPVTVTLSNGAGQSIGTATLSPEGSGMRIALAVSGLTAGEHAIHVHQTAQCDGPAFTSAGGHFNPESRQHGTSNPQGPHAGDMPNFTVDASGRSNASVVATRVTLDDGPRSVFTGGGTALVIHESADDMTSDPAGNAGARIACGVIRK